MKWNRKKIYWLIIHVTIFGVVGEGGGMGWDVEHTIGNFYCPRNGDIFPTELSDSYRVSHNELAHFNGKWVRQMIENHLLSKWVSKQVRERERECISLRLNKTFVWIPLHICPISWFSIPIWCPSTANQTEKQEEEKNHVRLCYCSGESKSSLLFPPSLTPYINVFNEIHFDICTAIAWTCGTMRHTT